MTLARDNLATLYDRDYALWIEGMIAQLTAGDWAEIDRDHLIEELADTGRRERLSLESNLVVILLHLLKWEFQPGLRSGSWAGSITEHRRRVSRALETSPSLKNHLLATWADCYENARFQASVETGLAIDQLPIDCPYSVEQVCDRNFWPGLPTTSDD